MSTILVTGGTGTLGRDVVAELGNTTRSVRLLSRNSAPPDYDGRVAWVTADLLSGVGLADAVRGVDVIVNCAHSPVAETLETDDLGLRRLLAAAKAAKVRHILHVSIVGIDRIVTGYYAHKLAGERLLAASGVPYSILRITQFHSYVNQILGPLSNRVEAELRLPVDVQFQPIDSREAARYLLKFATPEAHGMLGDVGGPEVLDLGRMARLWLDARGDSRAIVDAGQGEQHTGLSPGQIEGFRQAYNTTVNRYGKVTWGKWVRSQTGDDSQAP